MHVTCSVDRAHRGAELLLKQRNDERHALEVTALEEALEIGAQARDTERAALRLAQRALQLGLQLLRVLALALRHRLAKRVVAARTRR